MAFLQINHGKIMNAAKKKTCEELKPWIKLIWNHFWWSYTTCEGGGDLVEREMDK